MTGCGQRLKFELFEALASIATAILAFLAWRQIVLLKEQAKPTFEDSLTEHRRGTTESIPADVMKLLPKRVPTPQTHSGLH
jgi:hypothetical protein